MIEWQELDDTGDITPDVGLYCQTECTCHTEPLSVHCHLSIEEGQASVNCDVCGCSPIEYPEELSMPNSVPVKLTFVPEHPGLGRVWHGESRCDCGWWWEIEVCPTS